MKVKWQSCLLTSNIVLVVINLCVLLCILLETFFRYDCELLIKQKQRIIASSTDAIQKYPFVAALVLVSPSDMKFICGSSIIKKNWILTADHCVEAAEELEITSIKIVSNHNEWKKGMQHQVKKYIRAHQSLDLALVQVVEPFKARFERLIPVAKKGYKFIPNKDVTVIGWGLTSTDYLLQPNELKETELQLYNHRDCVNVMNTLRSIYPDLLHLDQSIFCAGPPNTTRRQDACYFNSGGPLVDDDLLIGVVSWGPEDANSSLRCGEGYLGIYVSLWVGSEWISEVEKTEKQNITIFIETPGWSKPIPPV